MLNIMSYFVFNNFKVKCYKFETEEEEEEERRRRKKKKKEEEFFEIISY